MRLLPFILCLLGAVAQAQTSILIDYDDGNPANGIHDASIRNGGFEDADGSDFSSTPFWDAYFPEGAASDVTLNTQPHTGTLRSFTTGLLGAGSRIHPSQVIPAGLWTIEAGDVFTLGMWVRSGSNLDATDRGMALLHVVDASANPVDADGTDLLLLFHFDVPEGGAYSFVSTSSTPVSPGSNWIGHQVQLHLLNNGARTEYMVVDDLCLMASREGDPPPVLRAQYRADGDTQDDSGDNQHGTPVGPLAYAPGFGLGQAFAFNGMNSAVAIPRSFSNSFSIACWIQTDQPGSAGNARQWWEGDGLVDGDLVGDHNDFGLSMFSNRVAFGVGDLSGQTDTLFSQRAVSDGAWHHVVATRDHVSGDMQLFVDGQLESTGTGASGDRDAPPALRIGSRASGLGYFHGSIDEVSLFADVLSPEQVMEVYLGPGDADGDGMDNEDEATAGTGWGDPGEVFALRHRAQPPGLVIDGKAGRRYQFWRASMLDSNNWNFVSQTVPLSEPEEIVLETGTPASGDYYRASVEEALPAQPNIIIILSDDQGYGDLSAYPHSRPDIHTPNMDRIANGGVLFTQAYVTAPVCSASRSGWTTGRYQHEWDPASGWTPGLPDEVPHLAELLKQAGYTTAKFGKSDFGTGFHDMNARTYPGEHGYDRFLGFSAHAHDFFLHSAAIAALTPDPNGTLTHLGPFQAHDQTATPALAPSLQSYPDGAYLTEILTSNAVDFIQDQAMEPEPFFLTISYNAVHHLVAQAPQRYLDPHGLSPVPLYDPATATPENPSSYAGYYMYYSRVANIGDAEMRKYYLANLSCLDDNIGVVLDELDQQGLADNTLVIFFSDNGGSPITGAYNGGLCGSKFNLFEGGIRVPFALRWPDRFSAGQMNTQVVSTLDILPTCLEAASAPIIPNLRGHSLIRPIQQGKPVGDPERILFWRWTSSNYAVRKGDWKLVKSNGSQINTATSLIRFNTNVLGQVALFNLADDPGEFNDRSADEPAIRTALQQLYDAWRSSL